MYQWVINFYWLYTLGTDKSDCNVYLQFLYESHHSLTFILYLEHSFIAKSQ